MLGFARAPDDAVMARYVLHLGGLGFVRTKTLKAFPETAYREIILPVARLSRVGVPWRLRGPGDSYSAT